LKSCNVELQANFEAILRSTLKPVKEINFTNKENN
jgi:hypothetical protein